MATKRINKFIYLYVLQSNYGYGHGFEDIDASEKYCDMIASKKCYRENEGGNYRIIQRREINPNFTGA
jgi:hypothetical protein